MHRFNIKSINSIGTDTILLSLQPKNNRQRLDFYPGQYAAIGFKQGIRPSPMRCFSIVSSPNNTDVLQFAIKVLGDFTNSISELKVGSKVFVRGAYGEFVIDENQDRRVILIAGGIGITPFISMIRYATETNSNIPITLLYSCRSQYGIPFYAELMKYEEQNPKFKVIFFITDSGIDRLQNNRAINGRISEMHFRKLTQDQLNEFTYFLCGPRLFMESIKSTLLDLDTDADRIITEDFSASSSDKKLSLLPKQSIAKWTYGLTAVSLAAASFFIMTLDLTRAVPKILSAENTSNKTTSQQQTSKTQAQSQQGSGTVDNSNSATSKITTSGSSTSTSHSSTNSSGNQSTPTITTTQPAQSYQAPVTSVS